MADHRSLKFSPQSRFVNSFYVCLLASISLCVLLTGCQKSDDQYQVITEEISDPETNSQVINDSSGSDQLTEAENASQSDRDMNEQEGAEQEVVGNITNEAGTDSTVATSEDSTAGQPVIEADKVDDAESSEDQNSLTEESTTEKVQSFINVQEEIARQDRLKKLGLGQTSELAEPREPKLLVEEREFSKERDSEAWRVSYDDLDLLKILNMEPVPLNAVDYLPDWLTQLEGKQIILRGWMYPPDRTEGIKGFIFVRDNQVCCFGPNAKAYDKLTVRLKKGTSIEYIQGRPFDVIGTFKIDPWIEDERDLKTGEFVEKVGMLYHLEDAKVVLD